MRNQLGLGQRTRQLYSARRFAGIRHLVLHRIEVVQIQQGNSNVSFIYDSVGITLIPVMREVNASGQSTDTIFHNVGDLVGATVHLFMVERLRAERPFSSPGELVAQIEGDIGQARSLLQGEGSR